MARESHFDLLPNTPLNSGDNHRPGCRIADQVTTHLNGRQDVVSRQGVDTRGHQRWVQASSFAGTLFSCGFRGDPSGNVTCRMRVFWPGAAIGEAGLFCRPSVV